MKKLMLIASCCAVLLLAAGCSNSNQPQDPATTAPLAGAVEQPAWLSPKQYDMTTSMTAIVRIDLTQSFTAGQLAAVKDRLTDGQVAHEGDLLAAFSGENCLGVDTLSADREGLFFLFVTPTDTDAADIQLRYYSTQLKNIFVAASSFPFSNNGHLGSVAEPYTPIWTIAK